MDDLLTAKQVQEILNIDRTTVYRMLKDGRLNGIKIGQHWRFPKEHILAVIKGKHSSAYGSDELSLGTFPVHCIQGLQNVFAEIAGLGSVTIDQNGNEITNLSNSCTFCRCIQSSPEGMAACRNSWKTITETMEKEEDFFMCHAGLYYTHAQMRSSNGKDYFLIAGQFFPGQKEKDQAAAHIMDIAATYKIDSEELQKNFRSIPVLTEKTKIHLNRWMEQVAQTLVSLMSERHHLIGRLKKISEISSL